MIFVHAVMGLSAWCSSALFDDSLVGGLYAGVITALYVEMCMN